MARARSAPQIAPPEVESLMAMGLPATTVAKRVSLSADSVRRHWSGHVPADKKAAIIGKAIFDKGQPQHRREARQGKSRRARQPVPSFARAAGVVMAACRSRKEPRCKEPSASARRPVAPD